MSIQTVAHKLVELCRQGKNFDVMHTLYAPDVVSIEGDGTETAGQLPVIHKSEVSRENRTIDDEKVRGPFFNGANQFAVHFTFDITRKPTGKHVTFEEVAVYTVNNEDKISREQFFYDGER